MIPVIPQYITTTVTLTPSSDCRAKIDSLSIPKQQPQFRPGLVLGGTVTATPDSARLQNFELSDFAVGTSLELFARQTRATDETPGALRASTFAPRRVTEEYDESP